MEMRTPASGDVPTGYAVACGGCTRLFDAEQANWCGCPDTGRTIACPHCGACSCRAPLADRVRFWRHATSRMRDLRLAQQASREDGCEARDGRIDVLVVDDEPSIRRAALGVARSMGLRTRVATNGAEGLRLARTHRPRVVLTDALKPRLDGLQLCRALKDDPACAGSRVVVMTSLSTSAAHEPGARRPFLADDYLAKPLSPAVLRTVLEQQMSVRPEVAHA